VLVLRRHEVIRALCTYCLQVARRIYKGIPEKMRGLVWSLLLGVEQEAKKNAGVYEVKINSLLLQMSLRSAM